MTLQVTAGGQQLSSDFKAAAQAGNVTDAFNLLQGLSLTDGLISCLELAKADRSALDTLAQRTSPMNKALFCVRLIKDGCIPQDFYAGVTSNIEYHFARIIILRARTEHKKLVEAIWPSSEGPASTKLFYPELVRANRDRRMRICDIAERHLDIGPDHPRQIALFSVGGLFDYALAKGGTRPQGTTCILFARSVLHAAGYNVIAPQTWKQFCAVPKGIRELPKSFQDAKVPATALEQGKRPQPGDIFHIRGGNYRDKNGDPTNTDSTHVGIVIKVEGDLWHTIEGGASDHITRRPNPPRKVVAVPADKKEALKYGKWTFENDIGLTTADSDKIRPIQGWFDISKIGDQQWMAGA